MINRELDNPFSVTKATEFSDQEINEYWVNFNIDDSQSIINLLNPNELLPKYILGSKGCGKTHILRYFSYPTQKIRMNNDIEKLVSSDKYFGIYSVLDALNSSRFSGKNISEEQWQSVFEYYFELHLAANFLITLTDILTSLSNSRHSESSIAKEIIKIFYKTDAQNKIDTVEGVKDFIISLKRKIDFEIVNAPFKRTLDFESVKLLFSPGDLIFGIPKIIQQSIPLLNDIKFIYILDEYEKLFEWQKIFINTIVWDKKNPCTFWIGARKHGYTTRMTKSGEEIKAGSEFQPVEIDLLIRKNEGLYKKFAKELYINRLKKFYLNKGIDFDATSEKNFESKFEKYSDDKIIDRLKNKPELRHIKNLRKSLTTYLEKNYKRHGIQAASGIDSYVSKLLGDLLRQTNRNPVEEKSKLFLFYQRWYKLKADETFDAIVQYINIEYSKYVQNEPSEFDNIKEKYKADFLAQLTSENNIKNVCYSGIDDFVNISWGNPRCFILILKKIVELARLRGERPLETGSIISLETQYLAIYETSKWFYEDAEIIGEKGKCLYKSIKYLTDLLRTYRFADKLTETTVSSFSLAEEEVSAPARELVKLAELHSLIIEINEGRKDKNSRRIESLYQLNKILAPLWNLPISRRGTLDLSKDLAESIFNPDKQSEFSNLNRQIRSNLYAPFFNKPAKENMVGPDLFN